jgi:hypothetical protein
MLGLSLTGKFLSRFEKQMIRGIVHHGVIQPVDPLPAAWHDGQPVEVEAALSPVDDFDEALREIERYSKQVSDEDWQRMEAALLEADLQAKAVVRQQMGLS